MKLIPPVLFCVLLAACGKEADVTYVTETKIVQVEQVNALDIVEIVDPCGDAPNIIDEVLIKLQNGQVLVSVSDSASGKNTRLSILPPGKYQTTDGSGCVFKLQEDGSIVF